LDQLAQAVLETRNVINSGQFNPRWLFYLKAQLSRRLQKGVENSVSTLIVLLLIDNCPSLVAKGFTSLNGKISEVLRVT
jgi:hypothetical protein